MKPAPVLLEPSSESESKAAPAPAFLVNLPPWHTVFLHNLSDLFRPGKDSSLHLYSRPGSFWPDVFVTSRLPWNRFAQSAICHVAFIVALWGSVQLWPQPPQVLDRPVFNRADVIYYAPSEYLPPLDTGGAHRPLPQKGEPEHAPQPIISVPAEADNRTQTIVTPSDIKLNHDVPMPNIVAWSQTPAQPAMPLASTTAAASLRVPEMPVTAVAPAPEAMPANRQRAPTFSQTAVAPAPEVDAESSRTLRAPQAAVVEPPPSGGRRDGAPIGRHQHRARSSGCARAGIAHGRTVRRSRQDASGARRQCRRCGGATASFDPGQCRLQCQWPDHRARNSSLRNGARNGYAGRKSSWDICRDSRGQGRCGRHS